MHGTVDRFGDGCNSGSFQNDLNLSNEDHFNYKFQQKTILNVNHGLLKERLEYLDMGYLGLKEVINWRNLSKNEKYGNQK